jgi:hypothetical protein
VHSRREQIQIPEEEVHGFAAGNLIQKGVGPRFVGSPVIKWDHRKPGGTY